MGAARALVPGWALPLTPTARLHASALSLSFLTASLVGKIGGGLPLGCVGGMSGLPRPSRAGHALWSGREAFLGSQRPLTWGEGLSWACPSAQGPFWVEVREGEGEALYRAEAKGLGVTGVEKQKPSPEHAACHQGEELEGHKWWGWGLRSW